MCRPGLASSVFLLALGVAAVVAVAEEGEAAAVGEVARDPAAWFAAAHADAQLLILGTFHFKDAGLDGYKPEVDVDILSESRQAELTEVLDRLAAWKPTKILVEWKVADQAVTGERYAAYRAGQIELGPNEVYQIGFRLAQRLGHERLYNVDVLGRSYPEVPDLDAYAAERGQEALVASPWEERYRALYESDDRAKALQTLSQHLLYLNSAERLRIGHGHYLLHAIALGDDDEYPAADSLTGWWYNRNLRIFANVVRVAEPGDRLLLLIGAGHVPILRHAVDASPELALVEVADVLGAGAPKRR